MIEKRAIAATKTKLKSVTSDVAYWRNQPYTARLAALETIRREFNQWKYNTELEFKIIYKIVKL